MNKEFIQSSKQFKKCQFGSFAQWNVLTLVLLEPFYLIKYFNANYTRDKNQNFNHCS